MQFQGLTFGVPREIMPGERRVAATPDTVRNMVAGGARVLVEAGAGLGSLLPDDAYRDAGAAVVADVAEIYAQSDVILKVKEPRVHALKNCHEVEMMRDGQYLIAFLHPAHPANHETVRMLAATGVISLTLDGVPRIARAQPMDALTSMSTVAGYKAVLMAADALTKFVPMVGTAVGAIPPANVFVIGAGVAGLQAIATAKRLGAVVFAADVRSEACEQAGTLGATIIPTGVPPKFGIGPGGYAKRLPDEWLVKERAALAGRVANADVLILSALIPGKISPLVVTESMVHSMQPGSVIVDIAVDQGGNCELTEPGGTVARHGVTIQGIQNIPGMMPAASTWLFASNIYNYVVNLVHDGQVNLNLDDEIIASTLVTRGGTVVHGGTLEAMASAERS